MRRTVLPFIVGALVVGACSRGASVRPGDPITTTTAGAATTSAVVTTTTGPASATTAASATTTEPGPAVTDDDVVTAVDTTSAFLDAWSSFDWPSALVFMTGTSEETEAAFEEWRSSLDVVSAVFEEEEAEVVDETIVVGFNAILQLQAFGEWAYQGSATLVREAAGWRIAWDPSVLHPALEDGHRFLRVAEWSPRAALLARDGTPIAEETSTKVVGVVPERIADRDDLLAELERLAGIDPSVVEAELDRPGVQPDWFLPVGELTADLIEEVGAELIAIPGVVFRDGATRAGPNGDLAPQIVGSVGEITAELLERFGPPYGVGDIVGRSGMELAYEQTLAGTPAQEIRHLNEFSRTLDTVGTTEGVAPSDVTTTFDVTMQLIAEAVLADLDLPAALVAIDNQTGEVRAAASTPTDQFDRSLGGLYPPGSTFKIVTVTALLQAGMSPDEEVACPAEVIINGRRFRNANDRNLGTVTLATAFAESCNTTFAQLAAERLTNEDLDAVAAGFGFDAGYDLPVFDNGGQFPVPPDQSGRAAAAIGQGQVLASPLHMATVAATAIGGGWLEPTIDSGDTTRNRVPLDGGIAASLRDMMLLVVTDGTAGNAKVDGQVVAGKTGSAEFGSGDDLDTHAWFVGYWADLAFAVVVEGGGSGGQVAAPIAAAFIERLS